MVEDANAPPLLDESLSELSNKSTKANDSKTDEIAKATSSGRARGRGRAAAVTVNTSTSATVTSKRISREVKYIFENI